MLAYRQSSTTHGYDHPTFEDLLDSHSEAHTYIPTGSDKVKLPPRSTRRRAPTLRDIPQLA
jgi:hypothetical protein